MIFQDSDTVCGRSRNSKRGQNRPKHWEYLANLRKLFSRFLRMDLSSQQFFARYREAAQKQPGKEETIAILLSVKYHKDVIASYEKVGKEGKNQCWNGFSSSKNDVDSIADQKPGALSFHAQTSGRLAHLNPNIGAKVSPVACRKKLGVLISMSQGHPAKHWFSWCLNIPKMRHWWLRCIKPLNTPDGFGRIQSLFLPDHVPYQAIVSSIFMVKWFEENIQNGDTYHPRAGPSSSKRRPGPDRTSQKSAQGAVDAPKNIHTCTCIHAYIQSFNYTIIQLYNYTII